MLPTLTNIFNGLIPTSPQASRASDEPKAPTGPSGRPTGDYRLAQQILADNPGYKQLLDTLELKADLTANPDECGGDLSDRRADVVDLRDRLIRHVGDWTEANTNPMSRADALYNLIEVLDHIDSLDGLFHYHAGETGNKQIEGFMFFIMGLPDTEGDLFSEFIQQGYSALSRG